ncbi:MAG TPA: YezD family protein [Desulfuromonadales bacterium]|nr:YezD family protein [Desulfuromonadales bacterium]
MTQSIPTPWNRELERVVQEALASIRFGAITLVVQDGRVIQVDKSEKISLNKSGHIDGSGI